VSDARKLQLRYDALLAGFVRPLLAGGTVELGQAIAPGAIAYFEHARSSDLGVEEAIFDALHRAAAGVAPLSTTPWPSRDLLLMAMAAHNLALATDPALDRAFARGALPRILAWVDALARHALVAPFAALRRRDVVARTWAYTYRFDGRPVDGSALTRPLFGSFKTEDTLRPLGALLDALDARLGLESRGRLTALLARSPLSQLLGVEGAGELRFGLGGLSVLSDDRLRGGVARALVEGGEASAAARLGRALGDRRLHEAPPALLGRALALCLEVHLTATLDGSSVSERADLDLRDPDVARYVATLAALLDDPGTRDELIALEVRDRERLEARLWRLSSSLSGANREEAGALVRYGSRASVRAPSHPLEVRP
jgi:hypothetical protein